MSSPAGLRYSQADFLAQRMPNSTRAGVILNPFPDLAGSLRYTSPAGAPESQPLEPEEFDSFASDFAPLPASADSSCLCVNRPESPGGDRPPNGLGTAPTGNTDGQLDSLVEMASKSQELPLVMKLEQLRKWQQYMQEQLKAHQLEELLHLQEEQQRLLGMMNGSQHCIEDHTARPGVSQAEWTENYGASNLSRSSDSSTLNYRGVSKGSNWGPQQEQESKRAGRQWPHSGQNNEEVHDGKDDTRSSREDDQEPDGVTLTESQSREEDSVLQDRPIKPGVGGQKLTFEELLEEQLRLEEQRLKSSRKQQQSQDEDEAVQAPPKRAFLKRGEGLLRFTNNRKSSFPQKEAKKDPKPQPHARVMCRSNSEPTAIQRAVTNGIQRLPVQRKKAVLNKENRLKGSSSPPQDMRAESKAARTKVLGSHQRQNTDGAESIQTDAEVRQTKQSQPGQVKERSNGTAAQTAAGRSDHNTQPNPVTKQVLGEPRKTDSDAARSKSCGQRVELQGGRIEGGVPQDSFELSFQEKIQRWECDRQLEYVELGEFELLEQAADELSFSSNSSFITKVLQMDQEHRKLLGATGLHLRRLSSTPIKSPPRGELKRCRSVGSSGVVTCSVTSKGFMAKMRDDTNKVNVEDEEEGWREYEHAPSSRGGSEFEHQEVVVKPPVLPSTLCFPAPSNPPYDKRSYQDEDSCRDSASDVTQGGDGESDSVLSVTDDSTLMEDKEGGRERVVFDDDDTWNDPDDAAGGSASDSRGGIPVAKETANEQSPPGKTLLRKVAVSRAVELDEGMVDNSANQEQDPPAASQLITRLFPSLKPKAQNAPLPPASAAPESIKAEEKGQQVQSSQLRERLVELEIEIERFKKENAALSKLRRENEKNQENLRKECLEFERVKADELATFEEYKKEENRKLQRERKLFEKHAAAARAVPDKKEREEIQALKQQLSSLQEEMKKRESRWSATHGRLRQQIDSLSEENLSLKDEVRMLEKLRLGSLKKNSVDAEKDRVIKDASLVTKGVKFASPLDSRGSGSSPPQSGAAATAAPRANARESVNTTTGMKSSLRRPSGQSSSSSSTSSSSAPCRNMDDKTTPGRKSLDQPPNQDNSHSSSPKGDSLPDEPEAAPDVLTHPDGKIEKVLPSGDRLIVFPNGTRREVSADGLTVKVTFFNGDTKQVTADHRVIYYYADAQTTQITYTDGLEVLHFPNNQTEKHFPDGRKEITFPDQTVKNLFPNGGEESVLTDGTIIQVNQDGTKVIHFNTGEKEVHTADYKRREYPDGTVKTVYTDGRQETRYPTGRLRIKDKDGNVVLDNRA